MYIVSGFFHDLTENCCRLGIFVFKPITSVMKCCYFIISFLILFYGELAYGQYSCCNYYDNDQNPGPGVESETFGIALGDIDLDGDLDAVVIDAYDDMEIYTNNGSGIFTYHATYGSGNSWFGAYLADVDQDNDPDIIVSAFYSGEGCEVWKNDGTGNFTLFQADIATSIAMRQIAVTDLNGDNLVDIFAPAYSGGGSQVWINTGTGLFENSNQNLTGSNCTQAAVADFDGDSDPDVYIAKTNGAANTVFLNNGLGYFTDTFQALGSAFSNGAQPSDVDNDGDYDVVVANWQVPSRIWLNDGNANFSEGPQIENDNYGKAVGISDIDYDCDDDVIIGSYGSNGLQIWTNDGLGNFSLCFENPGDIYAHGIAVGDMNNDLMPDVWVGNFSSSSGDHIFLKTTPVFTYDTINLCQGDSVYLGCEWQYYEGDYLEAVNCDTLCWYHMSMVNIDNSVVKYNTTLTAVAGYDAYQWFDCELMVAVAGADSNFFDPEITGEYAVEIIESSCIDTSSCFHLQTPLARFTADPTFGYAPLPVQFTDQSIDSVTTWFWDFGDNNSSSLQNPNHEYLYPGIFTVTLKISGPGGNDSITKQNYIEVLFDPPVADFIGEPTSGAQPLEVQFTDLSAGSIYSWEWDLGDGETSDEQNPLHTYENAGTYTVSLVVEGPGGDHEMVKTNYISVNEPAPETDFLGTPTSGQAPLTVEFTDLSTGTINSWQWFFGDGDSSLSQHPGHIYTNTGNFTVSLTATGPGGSDTEIKEDYILIGVGFEDNVYEKYMVYPNPFTDKLMLVFREAKKRQIILCNVHGEKVLELNTENNSEVLALEHLDPGIYFLKLMYKGQTTAIHKLIKNKVE